MLCRNYSVLIINIYTNEPIGGHLLTEYTFSMGSREKLQNYK